MLVRTEISTRGRWQSPAFATLDVTEYRALLGQTSGPPSEPPISPVGADPISVGSAPGLAVVAARRAFTRDRPLPPGGVLLGIDLARGTGWSPMGGSEFRCSTNEKRDHRGRLQLQIDVELRTPGRDGSPVRVGFTLLWPEGFEQRGEVGAEVPASDTGVGIGNADA